MEDYLLYVSLCIIITFISDEIYSLFYLLGYFVYYLLTHFTTTQIYSSMSSYNKLSITITYIYSKKLQLLCNIPIKQIRYSNIYQGYKTFYKSHKMKTIVNLIILILYKRSLENYKFLYSYIN